MKGTTRRYRRIGRLTEKADLASYGLGWERIKDGEAHVW